MKINWFTPLPPERTDIGNFTMRLLPELARRFTIAVWTDQAKWEKEVELHAEVRRIPNRFRAGDWEALNRAEMSFYNVGNDARFHARICQVAAQHPGVIVLHDPSIFELVLKELREGKGSEERACEAIRRYYGTAAEREYLRVVAHGRGEPDRLAMEMPMSHRVLRKACGCIIHHPKLEPELVSEHGIPLLRQSLAYPSPDSMKLERRRAAHQPGLPRRLLLVGYLNSPNRRLHAILTALARYPRSDRLVLDLVGPIRKDLAIPKVLGILGIKRQVKLHGYVSESRLDTLIDDADMAINLRYPTREEASGSLLRLWSRGLPTVCSRAGWYALQPERTLLFVDPEHEMRDLHQCFDLLLDNYPAVRRKGLAGLRELAAFHRPDAYAQSVQNFISQAVQYRPAALARPLAEHFGAQVAETFAGDCPELKQLRVKMAAEVATWTDADKGSYTPSKK